MNHTPVQRSRRKWPLCALLVGLIMVGVSKASAQPEKKLDKKVRQYLSIDKLPERTRSLILSAIDYYDNGEHQQSLKTLVTLLTGEGVYKPRRSLRAWSNQWLALNYFALDSSVATTKKYVTLSIDADVEIWREYAESSRMPLDLREIYEEYWDGLQENFNKKRHSWRLGLGTISRIDYSYRTEILEVLGGIGAPIVAEADFENPRIKFKQLLLYVRLQRVRKSIERIFGGYYFEFSFLEEDLNDNKLNAPQKLQFTPAVSVGSVLGYANKSSWEFGASFEVARLLFRKSTSVNDSENSTSEGLNFSQTTKIGDWPLSYGNFELYLRKWF